MRTFSADTIEDATLLKTNAKDIPDKQLDELFLPGYGIFAGKETKTAKLRFTPERARWVAKETWHPDQITSMDKDGNYNLQLPYSDERELIMDILKFGPDVEVLGPESLRKAISQKLQETLHLYK